ncbi:hypothetical protein [Caballeronia sordidicola]|uniref:Uncharacterized protein n=1 Tax=Caballeronia sordidicola TaxID=196367 RepID=A0A242MAC8_CABSO|nr:hypothetical protein [Caballeronia sordidicola]OTP68257.1 hypothetical protein PAMC26577_34335 [Caballeronia sordidicola]
MFIAVMIDEVFDAHAVQPVDHVNKLYHLILLKGELMTTAGGDEGRCPR